MRLRHVVFAMSSVAFGGGAEARALGDLESLRSEHSFEPRRSWRGSTAFPASDPSEIDNGIPYDLAIQKSVHNAFDREEPLLDQLLYHRIRSLELDVHSHREGTVAPPGEWFVYHEDNPIMRSSSCSELSDCLGQIAAFHRAFPRHEVVTLFVDLKEDFDENHRPSDLDDALAFALGRDNIVSPGDLMNACPTAVTVRGAVTRPCRFPTLAELRGKFILAMTGGAACEETSAITRYGGDHPSYRLAFTAPNVDARCPVSSYDARPDVVFFNMTFAERARAAEVKQRGLVARIYSGGIMGGLDSARDFAAARATGAAHLATDKVNFDRDRWTITHQSHGFPFTCAGCDDLVEPGVVLGMRAVSGDQWGTSDSGMFALESDAADATWSALVSVPSSHVEPFAKACLVARASDHPRSANVAVCRTFDGNPPRAQVRSEDGAATTSIDAPSFDGIAVDSPAFLKLDVKQVAGGSRVTASASLDGEAWSTIATIQLPIVLTSRGISVSSNGDAMVKGLFANLRRRRNGVETSIPMTALEQKALGAGARGDAFDGVFSSR